MTIGTNDSIPKFGTQDQVDDGTTSTIANNAFSVAADITTWTNDEDAPFAKFILECQFDTTMPTVGIIDLFGRPLDIQSTNEPGEPDANHELTWIGAFPIDFGVAADTNFFTHCSVDLTELLFQTSQTIDFYLRNNATGQTIGVDWNLWIQPWAWGPKA